MQCAPGEVCCYHESDPALDHCGAKGGCGASYLEFSCNSGDDCPAQICCAMIDGLGFVTGIACAASCNGDNRVMCDQGADCSDNTCDPFTDSYPNYGWCL